VEDGLGGHLDPVHGDRAQEVCGIARPDRVHAAVGHSCAGTGTGDALDHHGVDAPVDAAEGLVVGLVGSNRADVGTARAEFMRLAAAARVGSNAVARAA